MHPSAVLMAVPVFRLCGPGVFVVVRRVPMRVVLVGVFRMRFGRALASGIVRRITAMIVPAAVIVAGVLPSILAGILSVIVAVTVAGQAPDQQT